jgi:hypothetical protein
VLAISVVEVVLWDWNVQQEHYILVMDLVLRQLSKRHVPVYACKGHWARIIVWDPFERKLKIQKYEKF